MTTLYGGKSATPPCVSRFCRKENRRSHICPASQNTRWSHRACRPMAGSSAAKRGRRRLYSIPMVLPPEGARYGPSRSRTMGTRLSLPPDCRTTPPKLPARGRQSPASSLACASTGIMRPFRRFIIIATFGAKVKGFSQKTRRFFGENRENSSPSGYCAPRPFRPQNVGAKGQGGVYIINRCKKPANSARMPPAPPKSLCIAATVLPGRAASAAFDKGSPCVERPESIKSKGGPRKIQILRGNQNPAKRVCDSAQTNV